MIGDWSDEHSDKYGKFKRIEFLGCERETELIRILSTGFIYQLYGTADTVYEWHLFCAIWLLVFHIHFLHYFALCRNEKE